MIRLVVIIGFAQLIKSQHSESTLIDVVGRIVGGVEAKAKAARPGSCQDVLPPLPFFPHI